MTTSCERATRYTLQYSMYAFEPVSLSVSVSVETRRAAMIYMPGPQPGHGDGDRGVEAAVRDIIMAQARGLDVVPLRASAPGHIVG